MNQVGQADRELLIAGDDDLPVDPHQDFRDQQPNIQNTITECDVSDALLDIVQGPYKYEYWQSITILRGLLIAATPTMFGNDHSQVLSIMFVLQVYLILLNNKTPYKDDILNKLETSLTFLLLFIGVIGILNLTYLSTTDDNIVDLLQQLNIVKFVALLLPLPLLITFTIFDGMIMKRKTNVNECVDDILDVHEQSLDRFISWDCQ